ncbi:reverse transcriptase domain-containing protein [Tanacetum coccineum]
MSTQYSSNQIGIHFPYPDKSLQFRQVEESESDNLFHDHIQGKDENAEDVQMADHLRSMEELLRIPIVGAAETWLENEPPNSITSWDDLVSKFLNRFFPHYKTRELIKEITNFQQVLCETFTEAWERFKDLLRKCPHYGFSLLHQIDFFYNGLSQSDQDSLNTAASGNLMSKNTQEAFTIIKIKARVRTCRNKPQVSSGGGTSTQIDAITDLTKQVEALEYHFASIRETYDLNQEAAVQLMHNQMGQMAEGFPENPLDVLPSDTETYPREERKAITSMDGLTLDGSFTPHSNLLVYQEKEQEPETITEVVEIASSKSTPLVPPPETPPLSTLKPKENLEPNPHQLLIQEEKKIDVPTILFIELILLILCSLIPYEDSDYLVEETDILLSHFDDSLPEYETFSFDIKDKSSGSTTTCSDYSLPDYEAFCFDIDHIEEKSSGSTTTHSDFSLPEYDSFIFDLSIDLLPPADGSDFYHEEFADELAHIISPPEYDYFYFDMEADQGEFTNVLEKDLINLSTKEFTCIELNNSPLLLYDCDTSLSTEFPEIDRQVFEDIVFDPGILIIKGVQFQRF